MLRVPLVTISIVAREMRLKTTKIWKCCECCYSRYSRGKSDWNFSKSTKLWRCCECRQSQYWRKKCDWNFFFLRKPWICWECHDRRDIGARNAIESYSTKSRDVTKGARKISLKFVEKTSIFNRIYCANIVTSSPRNTSKACFVQKLSIALLAPYSWVAVLAPHSLRGRDCMFQSHIPHQYIVTVAPLLAVACKVTSQSPLRWHSSDHRHHAVELICNPVSSYFTRRFLFLCDWVYSHCHE